MLNESIRWLFPQTDGSKKKIAESSQLAVGSHLGRAGRRARYPCGQTSTLRAVAQLVPLMPNGVFDSKDVVIPDGTRQPASVADVDAAFEFRDH